MSYNAWPDEALNPEDDLGNVIFFGRTLSGQERNAVLSAEVDMSTSLTSQITLRIADPNFEHMAKGLFVANVPVLYEDLLMDVASVEVMGVEGAPAVEVRCRPRIVRLLKQRVGAKVMKNASPTDFVRAECAAVKATLVAQASGKRKTVARDRKREKGDKETPSSWTTPPSGPEASSARSASFPRRCRSRRAPWWSATRRGS